MTAKSISQTANNIQSPNRLAVDTAFESSIFTPQSKPTESRPTQPTVGEAIVKILQDLGVRYAFGVSGGGIGPLWATLYQSDIEVMHFRHESGAAFAATEAYLASERPVVVFTTTGPGITNALTGLFAARGEGAKVILLSATTPAGNRGRWACQETSAYTMPVAGLFTSGTLFNYATTIETGTEIPEIYRRLAGGLTQPGGFVAHISIPTPIQMASLKTSVPRKMFTQSVPTANIEAIAKSAELLSVAPFAIWVGFGARGAAPEIRALAEKTGAAVMCSPRGKGIFPENHPQFVGVTGFSSDDSVQKYMRQQPPQRILVLGTRLGEPTSFWDKTMVPLKGFIHVDINPEVPGVAYPAVPTFAISSEVKVYLQTLLNQIPDCQWQPKLLPNPETPIVTRREIGLVRPELLMNQIQQQIVEETDAIVMAEAGNSFAWATKLLRFNQPNRYRISTGVGAMGHAVTGVVGAALSKKAVAIVGDGAMLMNSEVSTAVRFGIPAVWIVLNDGRYNMCAQGMALQGFKGVDTTIPHTDFALLAQSMGADSLRIDKEEDVAAAIAQALNSPVPFVLDVVIDPNQAAPINSRVQSLLEQGAKGK
ncbi:MAG: thiamine pyrophosphate-binding protein [Pleurocapsa sp. SU_5_0]|nr:thiamine pyrophosphate-binding protein [Pleurocapsa sp. SU_5_0]NJO95359.1 thiamine pyrophosphate-binding protein [Pleurocapsa sp. CRU_1_2]